MLGFAAAAIVVSYLLTPWALPLLISSPRVLAAARDYLHFRVWGFVFAFAVIVFRAFYVGIVNTRILSWSAGIMLIVNVVGNYLLIFGNFGFRNGDRRRRAGVGDCRSGFRRRFRRLYPVQSQCFPLRA